MRFSLWRPAAFLVFVAFLCACTTIDVMNVGGPKVSGVAEAGTTEYKLGDTPVKIAVTGSGTYAFVALHENESTSVKAARALGVGKLVELKHGGRRNVSFKLAEKKYSIDPNRMFTDIGIKRNLKPYDTEAHKAVQGLAGEVVRRISGRAVVALHNNTNGAYSITSYVSGNERGNAADVHVNPDHDPDDFFFVTDRRMFAIIKAADYNVVLQSGGATDDGSLSVYCARKGIVYINVEAQSGHLAVQTEMLRAVLH